MKTRPIGDRVYGQDTIHDIIIDTLFCSQTRAFHKCPMRGHLTEIDVENYSETGGGPWRLLTKSWGSIECPDYGRNSTGSLADTMNI